MILPSLVFPGLSVKNIFGRLEEKERELVLRKESIETQAESALKYRQKGRQKDREGKNRQTEIQTDKEGNKRAELNRI